MARAALVEFIARCEVTTAYKMAHAVVDAAPATLNVFISHINSATLHYHARNPRRPSQTVTQSRATLLLQHQLHAPILRAALFRGVGFYRREACHAIAGESSAINAVGGRERRHD